MTDTSMIDRAVIADLLASFDHDTEFFAELLETYFDDSPVLISTLQAGVATGNAESLRRAAHSLKSNSASFGAMALSAQCRELELMGREGVLAGADVKVAAVAAQYELVRRALEVIRDGG
jgi:HPt (histidine-containing phosphotransfer) domain-containing protein